MRKVRILGIAPYRGLVHLMNQCAAHYPDIELNAMLGNMEEGLALAKKYYSGYDMIISRANTASMISQAVPVPVVDIGIHYYDVLRCIKIAENTGTKFAILGFHSLTDIAKNLCDLLKIKIDIFSFSINNWSDSGSLLDRMKEQGYETVICDMIPYEYAKLIGITPILLTSSVESLKSAINHAVDSWSKHEKLYDSFSMLENLVRSSSNRYLILDIEGKNLYSTLVEETAEEMAQQLRKELTRCRSGKQRSFFVTLGGQMYSVRSQRSDTGDMDYVIFRVMPSKIPMAYSKYGITILDKERALQNFLESFYSNTERAREIVASTEMMSANASPLMITGEVGTGKDRVACIYYAKSAWRDSPLYVVNCSLLNDKTWEFLINHYNSPFTDNGNTIYICNLESLSQARQKRLLSIILDTNLHVRNRLIFSCTQPRGKGVPHTALEYTNMLGGIHVTAKPLREQREDLSSSAAIYIDTLNQELGRQAVGLDEDAVRMLKEYDYPCNITQFKRILKKAVLETEQAYISGETIERILKEEGEFFVETADKQKAEKPASQDFSLNLEQSLDSMNREIVLHVLNLCGGNQTAAAKKLGISRTTLWRYVNR